MVRGVEGATRRSGCARRMMRLHVRTGWIRGRGNLCRRSNKQRVPRAMTESVRNRGRVLRRPVRLRLQAGDARKRSGCSMRIFSCTARIPTSGCAPAGPVGNACMSRGAMVEHRYSHSAGRASAAQGDYVERNRLFVVAKNFPRLDAGPRSLRLDSRATSGTPCI